jgi:hypothetical protein
MAAGCIPLTNRESGVPYFPLGEYIRGDESIYTRAVEVSDDEFISLQERGLDELTQNYNNSKFIESAKKTLEEFLK